MRSRITTGTALRAGSRASSTSPSASPSKAKPYFGKILIANRGEISCRVSKTAKRLGIKTVAIYSDPDANALHVREADEAVCVGPAPSSASYLNVPRILEAIRSTGSQAVHPGYGFLSENAGFASVLEKSGIKFIGPRASAITAMGDKIESKALAIKAGVNTIPGFLGSVKDVEEATRIARDIGYPVMIKASAGGGGKGMRIAYSDKELAEGYRLSKDEAKSSFGDDRLFVEKFIEDPRHIEIQLIADSHGNVVALPERECTIQRRNQKVIEESPSVLLDAKTRKAMQDQACALASAVGYESAGTVEFLADKHKNFYFLEMNTRLQVEHPVTEMVTGLDLVELMLAVAAGEKLPSRLLGAPLPILGHAFESRVYAEDPLRGFLPSTGRLSRYLPPSSFAPLDPFLAEEGTIREDAGVSEGSEISMFYDPMICKLVTHGPTRDSALDRMRGALDAYVVRGVGHNISFLRDLTEHDRFKRGAITTQFIKEEYPHGFKGVKLGARAELEMVAGAAVMNAVRAAANGAVSGQVAHPSHVDASHVVVTVGKRVAGSAARPPSYEVRVEDKFSEEGDAEWHVTVRTANGSGEATTIILSGVEWAVEDALMIARLGGEGSAVTPARESDATLRLQHLASLPDGFRLRYRGAVADVSVHTPAQAALAVHMQPKVERDLSSVVISPMPGKLISVAVTAGQSVELGQELAVMEAMKMQQVLRSPRKGVVKAVHGKAGETLTVDQLIVEFVTKPAAGK